MAQIIWTEPALQELDQIADYISLDNPKAAKKLEHCVCLFESSTLARQLLVWLESLCTFSSGSVFFEK
jgi:hypothetical protein